MDPTNDDLFHSQFHRDFFDLIKQYEDEFKDFVLDVSGDANLYTTIMEKLLISTNAMSLRELGAATAEANLRELEVTTSSFREERRNSLGSSSDDERQDDIAPLPGALTQSLPNGESRVHRQSMTRRNTMREVRERRQSVLQVPSETSKVEEKLAAEIARRAFLEGEILELERMLDEQEDEIDDLDKLVTKYKSKNKGLSEELKTKSRRILILEEKYSLLKTEHGALRARNDNLQLKSAHAEEDRGMKIMQLTSDKADGQEDINSLKRDLKDCNSSLSELRLIIVEKDLKRLALSEDMDTLHRELTMVKSERDTLKNAASSAQSSTGNSHQVSRRVSLRESIVAQISKVGKVKKDKSEKKEKKSKKAKSQAT